MATYFSDLHCHSTLFPFNQMHPSTWHENFNLIFPSQGDFTKLSKGKVRVLLLALYPVEQGFVTVKPGNLGTGNITDFLAEVILDMPKERADEIQDPNHDYFYDLLNEYHFLQRFADPYTHKVHIESGKAKEFRYKIVSNFNELSALLNLDDDFNSGPACDDTIAVVLTIEGAHSLGIGQRNTLDLSEEEKRDKVRTNIARLKKLGPPGNEGSHCPLFITFSHHFWNQLGGHAVSLWNVIRKVLDQNEGINEGITELGEFVVNELLSTTGGVRRILIDCAHMSIKVRRWYFNFLQERELSTGENIPIIVSHTGINGKATMAEAEIPGSPETVHDFADKLYEHSTEFNPWDVFLSDEEIILIHRSEGIIGLNMDHRIMMGKQTLIEIKRHAFGKMPETARAIWIHPLINEILHIGKVILQDSGNEDDIWDNICIGSDFDGMITPIKHFTNATEFPELNETLFNELLDMRESEPLLAGKTDGQILEITDKIMWKNVLNFLRKHYH